MFFNILPRGHLPTAFVGCVAAGLVLREHPALQLFTLITVTYFLPLLFAAGRWRNHPNCYRMAAINVYLGWTVFGWLYALGYAFAKPRTDV